MFQEIRIKWKQYTSDMQVLSNIILIDEETGTIDSNGLLQLYTDLGIDMMDPATIIFPYHCNMTNFVILNIHTQDALTEEQFSKGMKELGNNNWGELKAGVKNMKKKLLTLEGLTPIYKFALELFRDRGTSHKHLKHEVAVLLWGQLLTKEVFPCKEQWDDFLKEYQKDQPAIKAVTTDVWGMLLEFIKMTRENKEEAVKKVIDDGVWPTILEAFAYYLKDKLQFTSDILTDIT